VGTGAGVGPRLAAAACGARGGWPRARGGGSRRWRRAARLVRAQVRARARARGQLQATALAAQAALERWRAGARFLHRSGVTQEREWSPGLGVRVELRREARGSDVLGLLSPSKRQWSRAACRSGAVRPGPTGPAATWRSNCAGHRRGRGVVV
jgi:hypothetical protein